MIGFDVLECGAVIQLPNLDMDFELKYILAYCYVAVVDVPIDVRQSYVNWEEKNECGIRNRSTTSIYGKLTMWEINKTYNTGTKYRMEHVSREAIRHTTSAKTKHTPAIQNSLLNTHIYGNVRLRFIRVSS